MLRRALLILLKYLDYCPEVAPGCVAAQGVSRLMPVSQHPALTTPAIHFVQVMFLSVCVTVNYARVMVAAEKLRY